MSVTRRGLTAPAALLLGVGAIVVLAPTTAGAAEETYDACPDEAGSFLDNGGAYPPFGAPYPPFGAPSGDASGLIDCTSSSTPLVDTETNLALLFEFPGLPTDDCHEITELSVTTTGVPLGNGWGIVAYNSVGTEPILTLSGNDGSYQQYHAADGNVLPSDNRSIRPMRRLAAPRSRPGDEPIDPSSPVGQIKGSVPVIVRRTICR